MRSKELVGSQISWDGGGAPTSAIGLVIRYSLALPILFRGGIFHLHDNNNEGSIVVILCGTSTRRSRGAW